MKNTDKSEQSPESKPAPSDRRPTRIGIAPPRIPSSPGFYCVIVKREPKK